MDYKLKTLNLIILIMLSSSALFAQSDAAQKASKSIPDYMYKPISISFNNVSAVEALKSIAQEGKFRLNFNENLLPNDKKINSVYEKVKVIEILKDVIKGSSLSISVSKKGDIVLVYENRLKGNIIGAVIDKESREPLEGANIIVVDTQFGASADKNGNFEITGLLEGTYSIEASYIGYEKMRFKNILVMPGDSKNLNFELEVSYTSLSEIIITPGHFSLMEKKPAARTALKSEDIRSFPQLGEDIYRAVNRLPGVSGNDFSAKFTVRGGEHEEVLVLLDGMELYDPFHLKDLDGFFSIVDVEAINNIDMITGAFPVEFGNRLSAVFNMKTVTQEEVKPSTSIGISFLNARLKSEGSFANGSGKWLFIARKGYLDLLLKWLEPDDIIKPRYYDVLSKIQYSINSKHTISAHFLAAYDYLYVDLDDADMDNNYGNINGWVNWYYQANPVLSAQTTFFKGGTDRNIAVHAKEQENLTFFGKAIDKRNFGYFGIKQDWNYEISDNYLLKWGYSGKRFEGDYDFFFNENILTENSESWDDYDTFTFDTTKTVSNKSGDQFGAYLSTRIRLTKPLTMEIGIRYDNTTWTGDKNISPRCNLAYNISKKTSLRIGWGKFYQSQGINQLNTPDGDEQFYPAELAEHRVIGIEHGFEIGVNIRIEAYYKKLSSIRPKYINFQGSAMNPFPSLHRDRIRIDPQSGSSKGIELYVIKNSTNKLNWWFSYSYSNVEDIIENISVPRGFDQRHTLYLDMVYRFNDKWRLNIAWQYHSGRPFTESKDWPTQFFPDGSYSIEWFPGPLNAGRLPSYNRVDIRINRYFESSSGRLSTFLELRNLFNKLNKREPFYNHMGMNNGQTIVKKTSYEEWLPLIPSFGICWDF